MAAHETTRHERVDLSVEIPSGAEVAAATEMTLRATASCPQGCDLQGRTLRIMDGDAVVAEGLELTEADEEGKHTGELAVRAPGAVGAYAWRVVLPELERDDVVHAEASAPLDFEVVAHATSVVVWGAPSAIPAGERFTVNVGIKCLDGCDMRGRPFEIHDHDGNRLASAALGEEPWKGTSALYFAEVELAAPDEVGHYTWEARTVKHDAEAFPHRDSSRAVGVRTAAAPEVEVTVRARDKEKETPISGLQVALHPFKATTDEDGVATLRVPKGQYTVHVSGFRYFPFKEELEVTEDVGIDATLAWEHKPEIVSG